MTRLTRILIALAALLGVCAPLAYGHDDAGTSSGENRAPKIDGKPATEVSSTGATLRAKIDPRGGDKEEDWWVGQTTYRFQYGTSTAFPSATADGFLAPWQKDMNVAVPVTGLTPGTTYVYRAVAGNAAGTTYGPVKTFRTKTVGPHGPKSPKGDATPAPMLGHSVVAEAATGVVLVRKQGSDEFVPVDDAAKVPVDSTFDATNGTVLIEAARAGGDSNTGAFHGGVFKVHQSQHGKGITRLALRGGDFSGCADGANARAFRSGGKKAVRKLWGKDHGGRFKTSGRGSVATVRGTVWYTEDRCDGTLTKVRKGAVMVRERGTGRHKLLHRGESFFAHLPH
jgi:hypothetical protein